MNFSIGLDPRLRPGRASRSSMLIERHKTMEHRRRFCAASLKRLVIGKSILHPLLQRMDTSRFSRRLRNCPQFRRSNHALKQTCEEKEKDEETSRVWNDDHDYSVFID